METNLTNSATTDALVNRKSGNQVSARCHDKVVHTLITWLVTARLETNYTSRKIRIKVLPTNFTISMEENCEPSSILHSYLQASTVGATERVNERWVVPLMCFKIFCARASTTSVVNKLVLEKMKRKQHATVAGSRWGNVFQTGAVNVCNRCACGGPSLSFAVLLNYKCCCLAVNRRLIHAAL